MAQVQEIVDLVLQALAANAKTIDDLTEVLNVGESDFIELNRGRRISVNKLAELVGGSMAEVTHAELKALRDGGALVAGKQYRITDYVCTTVQENTQAADHQFDIIVTADDASTLNENARACLHDGDEYFAGCKLEAWKLKYTIDNDPERFVWADEENGKGVIYQMIDEWNNECPYDFKNIMFKRYFDEDAGCYKQGESEDNKWCYTFCMLDFYDGLAHDVTVEQEKYVNDELAHIHSICNKINPNYDDYAIEDDEIIGAYTLNDIVFVTDTDITAIEEDFSYGEFLGFHSNTFGNDCYNNTLGNDCYNNTFGNECYNNTFGSSCSSNIFGNSCSYNIFGNDCTYNIFCNNCHNNALGAGCDENMFGNNCSIKLGNNCNNNTFSDRCYNNIFGNDCHNNALGNDCSDNTFGDRCESITFVSKCYHNIFGTSAGVKSYYRYITFGSGVDYIYLNCTATTSSNNYAQNVYVNSGVAGTSGSPKTLTLATAKNAFLTTFGSANDVKIDV